MQSFILTGNLTANIELKSVGDDKLVANFSIAVRRPHSEETDFFKIEVWGKQAENCEKYLKKGSKVGIKGYIKTRSYEDSNGIKKYTFEVVAEEVEFLSSKPQDENNTQAVSNKATKRPQLEEIDDGKLPF